MKPLGLTIDELSLDLENPRINSASGQREALQKVISDEPEKLVRLAKSISKKGLNPMERFLVSRKRKSRTYTVHEGNRRTAALKILSNPAFLSQVNVSDSVKKRLEEAARGFSPDAIEPIPCVDVGSRDASRYWLQLRHTGENEGEGVVGWKTTAQSRFLGGEPALEALQFVKDYGDLSDENVGRH